jgi:hypothetical protein
MRLLGKSYSLEDVAFFGAGTLAAMAAGTSPVTARVRARLAWVAAAVWSGMLTQSLSWCWWEPSRSC